MPRKFVDDAAVVRLHIQDKVPIAAIAKRMRVQPPAIYRALYRMGHKPLGRPQPAPSEPRLPPPPAANQNAAVPTDKRLAEQAMLATERVNRDPCFRCGVRGDIGCGCYKGQTEWIRLPRAQSPRI